MTEWGELSFKVVGLEKAGQEVLARAGNIMVAELRLMFRFRSTRAPK
jgi:hypothetical protein